MSEHKRSFSEMREPDRAKRPWESPVIRYDARVRDCVRGFGKSGPNADSDPIFTSKQGPG